MRLRVLVAVATAVLTFQSAPVAAQRTGDRARLVFTISGAYIAGKGIWTIPNQPIQNFPPADTLLIGRSIKNTLGAGLSATYFNTPNVGLTAEAFLLGLGYEDSCRLAAPEQDPTNTSVCESINSRGNSAAAVAVSFGGVFRLASREFISPFARASVGVLFNNQSSVLTTGTEPSGALLVIYDDNKSTRIRPDFEIGVGSTVALSKGYHLRWEVRDNFIGIERVTGPTPAVRIIPPHKNTYKQLWSIHLGLDVILERDRGRRY